MQMHFRVDVFDFGKQTLCQWKDYNCIFSGNDHPQPVLALAVAFGLGISDQNGQKCWKAFSAVKHTQQVGHQNRACSEPRVYQISL